MNTSQPKPKVIVLSGYGLNCEHETRTAFEHGGGSVDIVHINDVIASPKLLRNYQILSVPGGFSYGDDAGSGKAYAHRLMHHVGDEVQRFLERDTLSIGICNGFQVLTSAGILPGSLISNDQNRFLCRWVDLKVTGESPWLKNISKLSLPIAHGEGKYYDSDKNLLKLSKDNSIALTYCKDEMSALYKLPVNPNGSLRDIAGITQRNGRILGLMPHPERGSFFTQLPHWTKLREQYREEGKELPTYAAGIKLFENAVSYFAT